MLKNLPIGIQTFAKIREKVNFIKEAEVNDSEHKVVDAWEQLVW